MGRRVMLLAAGLLVTSCAYRAGGGGTQVPSGNAVSIQGMAFSPSTLQVKAGETVTWTNNDSVAHTVTADGSFDSGNLAPGGKFSHQFTAPGSFAYHCAIHPSMTATITVTAP